MLPVGCVERAEEGLARVNVHHVRHGFRDIVASVARAKNLGRSVQLYSATRGINGFDERFTAVTVGEDTDLRDRAMRLRPRPRVKNLYLKTWVYHLWAPRPAHDRRHPNRAYYETARPVYCEKGLVQK